MSETLMGREFVEDLIRRAEAEMVALHGAEKWAEMNAWAEEQIPILEAYRAERPQQEGEG